MSATNWEQLRFCSSACRKQSRRAIHGTLEHTIIDLLELRAPSATICPSEAARIATPEQWQQHMEDTRRAARRLAHRGVVTITQKGRAVDPTKFRGPIRIARGPSWHERFKPHAS